MACVENECLNKDCKHVWFDNLGNQPCPKCGGDWIGRFHDEECDRDEEETCEE